MKEFEIKDTIPIPGDDSCPSNPNLPTLFSDMFSLTIRTDGVVIIRFLSRIPGLNSEQCRIATNYDGAKKLINLLSEGLNNIQNKSNIQISAPKKIDKKNK